MSRKGMSTAEGWEVMREEFLGLAERSLATPVGLDERDEDSEVYRGKRMIAIKYAELEGKSSTSDQSRERHMGRTVAMGHIIYDRQMQPRKPGQEDIFLVTCGEACWDKRE